MGADIFFFTDVDLLNDQTAEQAFGPVSDTISQFRVVNTFTVLDKANIYAICRGKKLTYQDGTVILYPYDETIFDGLPVQYFIYTNVDVSNVVTQLIPEDESDDLLIAQQYKYSEYLESVEAGAIIAETYDNTVSIAVVTTGVDDGLRAFEKYDDCVTINGGENSKRQREKILSYMDISAFYGMFVGDKIKVKKNTRGGTVYKSKEKIYNYILSKFWNRNKIYVDIRDSRYYSLNYRKNEETQHCIEVQGNISSNVEYETFPQWPLLIIEEPKDSNNADSLSLKYYEAIVQISNGRKTYCVFGYKRKGKRLKKQRLYNTTEISISFPVVNGNYVSSYYRYMVDTDVTNQEGLNGLFQVRPFEEYTRYYNSSAKVQSWLTGRLCFYENDVVACGIALDYGKDRITFWSVPINNPSTRIDRCVIKTNDDESFFQVFYNKRKKEPVLKKYSFQYNKDYIVDTLKYTSQYENIFDLKMIFISIMKEELPNLDFNNENIINVTPKDITNSCCTYNLTIDCYREDVMNNTYVINDLYSYNRIQMLLTTKLSALKEDIIPENPYAGISIEENSIESYSQYSHLNMEQKQILKNQEKNDIQQAIYDIARFNRPFYEEIHSILALGIQCHNKEDEKSETFYPHLHIKFSNLENIIGKCHFAETEKTIYYDKDNSVKEDFIENGVCKKNILIDAFQYQHICKTISSKNSQFDIENFFNDNRFYFYYPNHSESSDENKNPYKYIPYQIKSDITIEINLKGRIDSSNEDKDKFSERRFYIAMALSHELGHFYARMVDLQGDYLWRYFEAYLRQKNYLPDSSILPQNDLWGHIWGMPSGVKAVKEELLFIIKFHKYLYEKQIAEESQQVSCNMHNNIEHEQFVKFIKECVSHNYNPTNYLLLNFEENTVKPYKYNNNILLNFAQRNNI